MSKPSKKEAAKILGSTGGTARAKRHSKSQLSKWGKLGGRPVVKKLSTPPPKK